MNDKTRTRWRRGVQLALLALFLLAAARRAPACPAAGADPSGNTDLRFLHPTLQRPRT